MNNDVEMEVVATVTQKPLAFEMAVNNANGSLSLVEVTWGELENAEIGTAWSVSGGGSLWEYAETATVVYKDTRLIALCFESIYWCDGQSTRKCQLRAFRF